MLLFIIPLSGWSAVFKVNSNPDGADIFIKKRSDDVPAKLGVTPFNSTLEEVRSKFNVDGTFFVEVSKEGHETTTIMLAPISAADIELNLKLAVSKDLTLIKKFDKIVSQLFEAQRLTRDKNYDAALKMLDEVEKEEKYLSIIYEMRGGVYYLRKDFSTALSFYRKAFSINAENKDAYSMKLYLEKSLGIKKE